MVSGHFLHCLCTDLGEIQNGHVFWVKEDTYWFWTKMFEIWLRGGHFYFVFGGFRTFSPLPLHLFGWNSKWLCILCQRRHLLSLILNENARNLSPRWPFWFCFQGFLLIFSANLVPIWLKFKMIVYFGQRWHLLIFNENAWNLFLRWPILSHFFFFFFTLALQSGGISDWFAVSLI